MELRDKRHEQHPIKNHQQRPPPINPRLRLMRRTHLNNLHLGFYIKSFACLIIGHLTAQESISAHASSRAPQHIAHSPKGTPSHESIRTAPPACLTCQTLPTPSHRDSACKSVLETHPSCTTPG